MLFQTNESRASTGKGMQRNEKRVFGERPRKKEEVNCKVPTCEGRRRVNQDLAACAAAPLQDKSVLRRNIADPLEMPLRSGLSWTCPLCPRQVPDL